ENPFNGEGEAPAEPIVRTQLENPFNGRARLLPSRLCEHNRKTRLMGRARLLPSRLCDHNWKTRPGRTLALPICDATVVGCVALAHPYGDEEIADVAHAAD